MRTAPRSAALAAVLCGSALVLAGCGGDDDDGAASAPATTPATGAADTQRAEPIPGTPEDPEKAAVVRGARAYVTAINRHRARELCALLAPGSLGGLDPPRGGPGCRSAMEASIGYADPRGYPHWRRTRIERIRGVEVDGDRARVTMTVFHVFADRRTVSSEDDVVHLVRMDGDWRVAKASATLHRAVGKPDVAPDVLEPPGG
jgi:hypothetical protein